MGLILLVLLVLLICGAFGSGLRYPEYRNHGIGIGTVLIIILIVLLLTGRL